MIALIDFDSILYTSVYKVLSFSQIREGIENYKDNAREWFEQTVLDESINRAENQILKIANKLQDMMQVEISGIELYITTCRNSFRKELEPTYKAKRKRNKWVSLLREYYLLNGAISSDTHEADDLIADRAKELGKENCIVVSIDKDLKQIGGWYWSYYRQALKDMDGEYILDENGNKEFDYKYHEVEWITDDYANKHFWKQMLTGDSVDNIKGVKGIGDKRADKMLNNVKNPFISVARCYLAKADKEQFRTTYKLLKLGI